MQGSGFAGLLSHGDVRRDGICGYDAFIAKMK